MSKSKGTTLHELSDATGRGAARSHDDVAWQPGAGHNSRGLEHVLAQSGSAIEATLPSPANPGARRDSNIPFSPTKHVKSNTVKREHFADGNYPGNLNDPAMRPTTPTMETDIDRDVKQPDGPVPTRDRQMPHKGDTSKAEEIAREDASYGLGDTLRGVMDR